MSKTIIEVGGEEVAWYSVRPAYVVKVGIRTNGFQSNETHFFTSKEDMRRFIAEIEGRFKYE